MITFKDRLVFLWIIWDILMSAGAILWLTAQLMSNTTTKAHYIVISMCTLYFVYSLTLFRVNEMSPFKLPFVCLAQDIADVSFGLMTGMVIGLAPYNILLPQIICIVVLGSLVAQKITLRAYDIIMPQPLESELMFINEQDEH